MTHKKYTSKSIFDTRSRNVLGCLCRSALAGLCLSAAIASASAAEFNKTEVPESNWYGEGVYFGYEYDMHANESDTDLGKYISVDYLVNQLKLAKVDLLQSDTKGHEGLVSWDSKTPAASVASGVVNEMIDYWVKAGNELGIPCQAHYSGIFDQAAGKKFPEWNAVDAEGQPVEGKMCPRGPYVDELLIPQAKELIDRYGISALWVDGEIWAVTPCYCTICTEAYQLQYGQEPPRSQDDPDWAQWIGFTREGFHEYVAHYATEIHKHSPETRVCSNWLHSFRDPGIPWVPTDYLSGDNLGTLDQPNNTCEARFLSTRERSWEIVVWGFYYNEEAPWLMKSLDAMKQHTVSIIALGGSVNIYNQPKGHRDARIPDWQARRIGELSDFLKARKDVSWHSETIPNAVILHSEHDFHAQKTKNIWEHETGHLDGAVQALLDNSIATDIMDEWALLKQIERFPLVVAPSQESMSPEAVETLKTYVRNGGKLLVTGPESFETFGADFLGVDSHGISDTHNYHLPAGEERFPLSSVGHQGSAWTEVPVFPWREVTPTTARGIAAVTTTFFEEDATAYFGATINQVGEGAVAYIPCDIMTYYNNSRYTPVRQFIEDVIEALNPAFPVDVQAPVAIESILRTKCGNTYVHLINRASGLPIYENVRGSDDVPAVGPVSIRMELSERPASVKLLFESATIVWDYTEGVDGAPGVLSVLVPSVQMHAALEITN